MLWQVRPYLYQLCQFRVFLQDFVQAGGQDRALIFRKCFIISGLLIFVKGFESPWGYFVKGGGIQPVPEPRSELNFHTRYNRIKHHSTINDPLDASGVFSPLELCKMAEQI